MVVKKHEQQQETATVEDFSKYRMSPEEIDALIEYFGLDED